jgi:diguanylate cyclase (GGDEF)-like protein
VRTLGLRLLPGAVLVGATILLLAAPALAPFARSLLPAYPFVVFLAGALLAWRFRRWRMLAAIVMLAAAERALHVALGDGRPAARVVTAVTALALPLNVTMLAWSPDRGSARGVFAWSGVLVAGEALAMALLTQPEAAPLASALVRPLGAWRSLPAAAAIAFAAALALATLRLVWRPQPLECGTVWALLAALIACASGQSTAASIALAGAGLVMLVSLVETSHAIAYVDELTGLPGRRALGEALARLDGAYTIAMADIDHFKKFNDTYGHDAGDQLLRMIGARLAEVGGGGRPFRYGGEEFAVLFPGADLDDALPHLETLRRTIEATGFALRGADRPRRKADAAGLSAPTRRVSVSVSIGAAEVGRRRARAHEVLDAADAALYRAKRGGRNRVCV